MRTLSKLLLSVLLLAFWAGPARAQETPAQSLTLAEALELARQHNRQNGQAQQAWQVAESEKQMGRAVFLPRLQVSETFVNTNNPLQVFGIRLMQANVKQEDFNPALLNDPGNLTNFTTKVELMQPLLNFDGFAQYQAAQYKATSMQLQSVRMEQAVELQVKQAYYQLQLARQGRVVLEKALTAAREHLRLVQDLVEQGYAQTADRMSVEIRLLELETQLAETDHQLRTGSDQLAHLLGMDNAPLLLTTDSLQAPIVLATAQTVSTNRADLQALDAAVNAHESMIRASRNRFLPSLNAFGSYEWNDRSMFGMQANNYMVGARLQWNLYDGGMQFAERQKARAERDKMQIQREEYQSKSEMELREAARKVELMHQKNQLGAKAVAQAEEALRVRADRYREGMEKTADILQAEALISQKQLAHLQTLFEYQMAVFHLQFLSE